MVRLPFLQLPKGLQSYFCSIFSWVVLSLHLQALVDAQEVWSSFWEVGTSLSSPPPNLCAFGCTIVWFVWLFLPICADLGSLEMPVTHCAQLCHGWSCYLGGVFYFQLILFSWPFWFLHLEYMILGSRGSPTKKNKQTNKQQSSSWFSYFPILFLRLQCHLLFSSVPSGLTLGSWNPSLSYVNCVLVTGSKSAIGEFSHLLQQYISNLSPHWVVVSI